MGSQAMGLVSKVMFFLAECRQFRGPPSFGVRGQFGSRGAVFCCVLDSSCYRAENKVEVIFVSEWARVAEFLYI